MNTLFRLLILTLLTPTILRAQNEVDALRYSFTDFAGSARSAGMSGAFSAAGADLSSLHGNPAGLAAYRRGAAEINLSYRDLLSTANFAGQSSSQSSSDFAILNAGVANVFNLPGQTGKKIVFGASIGKNNYFHEKNVFAGDFDGSLLESFAQQANGNTVDDLYYNFPFTAAPAHYTYLLDLDDTLNLQYRYNASLPALMQHSVTRSGSQSEMSFACAFEAAHSLMVGLAVKMISSDFNEEYNHNENFTDTSEVSEFNFSYDLQSLGDAYSLSVGAIYTPIPQLRLGFSAETPALLMMDEYFTTETASQYLGENFSYTSDELQSSSIIRIPGKIQAHASAMCGDICIINIDAERRSYQNSMIEGDGANTYDYSTENRIIQSIYRPSSKVSLGIEGRIAQRIHLRTGLSWIESPYKELPGIVSKDVIRYALGGGYRTESWCVDAALQLQNSQSQYFMYDPSLVAPAAIKSYLIMITLGVGYRFKA